MAQQVRVCWLLLQKTQAQFSAHVRVLTTPRNSSSRTPSALFWLPWALHMCGTYMYTQTRHTNKNIHTKQICFKVGLKIALFPLNFRCLHLLTGVYQGSSFGGLPPSHVFPDSLSGQIPSALGPSVDFTLSTQTCTASFLFTSTVPFHGPAISLETPYSSRMDMVVRVRLCQ